MDPEKPKFNWTRLLITIAIVLVTAGVVGGTTWYLMDKSANDIKTANDKSVNALQKQIGELSSKTKNDSDSTTDTTTTTAALSVDKLKNATYTLLGKTYTLSNGTYETSDTLVRLQTDKLSYQNDNTVAIIANIHNGGTGTFYYLEVMGNFKGNPQYISSVELGDRVVVNSVKFNSDNTINLDMTVAGPDDPSCCPSQHETRTYTLTDDSKLILK